MNKYKYKVSVFYNQTIKKSIFYVIASSFSEVEFLMNQYAKCNSQVLEIVRILRVEQVDSDELSGIEVV